MRSRHFIVELLSVVTLLALAASAGSAHAGQRLFFTPLSGEQEVPSVISPAKGTFIAVLQGDTLYYQLTWKDLEGGDPADSVGAHIHLGQRFANGAVMAFLCGGPLPACSGASGSISGTITAADVGHFGSAAQGVGPGEFEEFLDAIRRGIAYVNLHTPDYGGGEIRGQLR